LASRRILFTFSLAAFSLSLIAPPSSPPLLSRAEFGQLWC